MVQVSLIGAGSATFAAGIVRDLCVTAGLHGSHVALMDIDAGRLAMVARMAQRLSDELDAGLSFSQTLDREEALRGADFVINTAQVGGHAWTEAQRELAERHGYYRGARLHDPSGGAPPLPPIRCGSGRLPSLRHPRRRR